MERPNAWKEYTPEQEQELDKFAEDYRQFISVNKIEREICAASIEMAREAGYRDLAELVAAGEKLSAGDKVYASNHGKALLLVELGKKPLAEGLNILGAHIDSPRLDVKQNPLDEKNEIVTLDTHYYGGVKKYQWVTIPLAIHGVVCKKDGTTVPVTIGEADDDPVFCVSDLLIHLSKEQLTKTASEVIEGELLDVIIGNRLSAELEVVPAGPARDLGLDRSMILGYGHDDSSCAYPSLVAQLECEAPEKTAVTILVDKEEIGSVGATGMTSRFFEDVMAEILALAGEEGQLALRRCLRNSRMLSSDVSAGFDPSYASVFEPKNSCYLGHGLTFNKYTGSRGKSGSNDADAEYVAEIRACMDGAGVHFQTAELGKVDAGGGGTIAYILAEYGMNVIDCGVPVLSMHAPWEVISKADVYEAYRGYKAFLKLA